MCLSGLGQIAALWLRELTGTALVDGLLGTVYVVIGIGLFGHSRFSLFMAIVIPCCRKRRAAVHRAPARAGVYAAHCGGHGDRPAQRDRIVAGAPSSQRVTPGQQGSN